MAAITVRHESDPLHDDTSIEQISTRTSNKNL